MKSIRFNIKVRCDEDFSVVLYVIKYLLLRNFLMMLINSYYAVT